MRLENVQYRRKSRPELHFDSREEMINAIIRFSKEEVHSPPEDEKYYPEGKHFEVVVEKDKDFRELLPDRYYATFQEFIDDIDKFGNLYADYPEKTGYHFYDGISIYVNGIFVGIGGDDLTITFKSMEDGEKIFALLSE